MTDFELIALAGERLRQRESEALASRNVKGHRALVKLHKALEKAMKDYALGTGGDVVAYSGGIPKDA